MSYFIYEFNVELLITFMFKYRKVIKSNTKMIKFLNSFALIALMAVVLTGTSGAFAEDAVTDTVAEALESAAANAQVDAITAQTTALNAVADAGLINTALEEANATKTSLQDDLVAAQAILESDTATAAEKAAAQATQDTINDNLVAAQILVDDTTDAKTAADAAAAKANNEAEAAQALADGAAREAAQHHAILAANSAAAAADIAEASLETAQKSANDDAIARAEAAVAAAQAAQEAAERANAAVATGDYEAAAAAKIETAGAALSVSNEAAIVVDTIRDSNTNPIALDAATRLGEAVIRSTDIIGAISLGNVALAAEVRGDVADLSASASGSVMTLGDVIDNTTLSIANLPQLINYFGYIMAIFFMGLSLFKFYSHVQYGPQQTPLIEPIKYFGITAFAAALPSTAQVLINSFDGFGETGQSINRNSGWADTATGTPGTLDTMMMALMQDIYMPMQILLTWFGYVAGFALLLIAIHRLTKTAQQGRQGPAGAGTLATFALAAVMLSFAPSIGVMTESLFGARNSMTTVSFLAIDSSLSSDAQTHTRNVIVSVLVFLVIVGLLSMARGFFILRGVAEGQQQATLMGGLSHVVAGAILVNFGQFANIVQNTLGIEGYGVLFN